MVRKLHRTLWRHRRLLAVGAAAALALHAVETLSSAPPTRPVVVVKETLSAGSTVAADDITISALPVTAIPAGALSTIDDAVGHTVAVSLKQGAPLLREFTVSGSLTEGLPAGTALLAVSLPGVGWSDMLQPGLHLDLVSTAPADRLTATAGVIATDVLVVGVSSSEQSDSWEEKTHLVFVAVPEDSSPQVAQHSAEGTLTAVLKPRTGTRGHSGSKQ